MVHCDSFYSITVWPNGAWHEMARCSNVMSRGDMTSENYSQNRFKCCTHARTHTNTQAKSSRFTFVLKRKIEWSYSQRNCPKLPWQLWQCLSVRVLCAPAVQLMHAPRCRRHRYEFLSLFRNRFQMAKVLLLLRQGERAHQQLSTSSITLWKFSIQEKSNFNHMR